jgi:hypothetical protein
MMMTSTYWARRWNASQIDKDSAQDVKMGNVEMKVVQLERMVSYLIIRLVRGQQIDLQDKIVREFLNLSKVRDDQETLDAILSHLVKPLGLLSCPSCGAKIKDVPGVVDEKCHWCGAYVGSER